MSNVSGPSQSRLNVLYTRWVRAADWAHAHRAAVRAAGAPLVVVALVAINQLVLLDFPNSGDGSVYLYQARTMAAGRLWNAPIAPAGVFALNYVVQEPGRAFGSFPVGWPLALAAVIRVGVPPWLLTPVLGALTPRAGLAPGLAALQPAGGGIRRGAGGRLALLPVQRRLVFLAHILRGAAARRRVPGCAR